MPDTKINNDEAGDKSPVQAVKPASRPRKKSIFRRLTKYLVYLIITFIAVFVFLFLFVQTERFNTWLLDYSFNKLNESWKTKDGKIYAESLRGNIFTGLRLYNGNITVKKDTLIKFANVQVKYNLLALLNKEMIISHISVNSPEINLTKVKDENGDLVWNLDYLLRSEEKKVDTAKKVFDWKVKVEDLKINNGSIRMIADRPQTLPIRSIKMKHIDSLNFDYLDLYNLHADLDAMYSPDNQNLNLRDLSFNTNSDFNLKKLSVDIYANESDSTVEVKGLEIKTDRSQLNADIISMDHFYPFSGVEYENFKYNDVKVNLVVDRFNFSDLKFFLPQLNFLDNTVSLELKAQGKYGKLNVDKLILHTPNSYINVKGRVDNLNDPSQLSFDITGNNLVLDAADTRSVLPGLRIPDYSNIGKVNADITFSGEPLNFKTEFDVRSQFGSTNGTLSLNMNDPQNRYDAKIETKGLDIGSIIRDEDLKSNINAVADINGSGFDFRTISAKVNYDLVNSRIYNQEIIKSAGTLDLNGGELNADITLLSDRIQAALKGKINLTNFSDAEYTMKGSVKNLDVSEFTKHTSDRSNLNFSFDIQGRGTTLGNIEGIYDLNFNRSYYAAFNIPPSPVKVSINSSRSNGNISIISDFFDFKANGTFNLGDIAGAISDNISAVKDEVIRKFGKNTLLSSGQTVNVKSNSSDFNFNYEFIAKDILPVTKMFDTAGFNFKGDIKGSLSNSPGLFTAKAEFGIQDFIYPNSTLGVKSLRGSFDFENDYSKPFTYGNGFLYPVRSEINLKSTGLRSGNFFIDSLNTELLLSSGDQRFRIYGKQDTTFALNLIGDSHWDNDIIAFNFDTLLIGYHKRDLINNEKISVLFNPAEGEKTFSFKQFDMSNSMMKLNIAGDFSLEGNSDLDIEANSIRIGQLTDLIYPRYADYTNLEEAYFRSPIRGNIRRLSVTFKGNPVNPSVNLEMNSDLIRYENIRVGRIDAFMDYSNSILSADVLLSNATGDGKLRLTGEVPIANPFGVTENNIQIAQNPVDLKLTAHDFQLSFFSRLLPRFGDVSGLLNGEITTIGTVQKPLLTGEMNVTDGRFLLGITGLYHRFYAKFRTDNSNLIVDEFRILNVDDDIRHIDFWGNINFEGLKLNDIDLTSSGDLVVLDQSAQDNDLGISGDMIVGVGSPAITLKGNAKSISLTGQFLIKSANVKVASIAGSSYDLYSDNFVYRILKDTVGNAYIDTIIEVSPERFSQVDPFLKSNVVASSIPKPSEFIINYDLNVKTVKDAAVSIMFNNLTKDELYGQLSADLRVTNNTTGLLQVYGNLEITGDSYYRFYRNFKVKDSRLTFTGPPSDPLLNIHAVYENKTSNEAIGSTISSDVIQIVLEIHGTKNKPELKLTLLQGGNEVTGPDAQSDAVSYLLFGVSKNELISGQSSTMARNVGATTSLAYLSPLLGNAVRDIVPFITNAQVNYSEGSITTGTDIMMTSEVGDATVRFGGKILSGFGNAEVVVEYPLNKLLGMNLSNNLILEASRIVDESSLNGGRSVYTGVRLTYKIRY